MLAKLWYVPEINYKLPGQWTAEKFKYLNVSVCLWLETKLKPKHAQEYKT